MTDVVMLFVVDCGEAEVAAGVVLTVLVSDGKLPVYMTHTADSQYKQLRFDVLS